ncbi:MAG: hypothetical protein M3P51_09220 [Chloroflexota bacterium]|nr:hypothetical protein [Chloroflexota bacterium]
MSESQNVQEVRVEAMYGARTRQPAVMLRIGESFTTMSPAKAREIGAMLIEAAEASEQDGFLMEWVQEKLGASFEQAGVILLEFREHRKKWRDQGE